MMQNSIKAEGYWQNDCWFGRMWNGGNRKKPFVTSQECLLLYVGHTKEGAKGILAPKKVPEHLIWAAECEGEFWEIWRKFWTGGACGEREWQEKNGRNERGGRDWVTDE